MFIFHNEMLIKLATAGTRPRHALGNNERDKIRYWSEEGTRSRRTLFACAKTTATTLSAETGRTKGSSLAQKANHAPKRTTGEGRFWKVRGRAIWMYHKWHVL